MTAPGASACFGVKNGGQLVVLDVDLGRGPHGPGARRWRPPPAIGSPTYRTRSIASTGWSRYTGPNRGRIGMFSEILAGEHQHDARAPAGPPRSWTDRISACGTVLRTSARWQGSGRLVV